MADDTQPPEYTQPQAPKGTPQDTYPGVQYQINTATQLMEISGDIGRLKEAVDTLKSTVEKQGESVLKLATRMAWAAGLFVGGGAVILFVFNFIVDKGLEKIAETLSK